MTRTIRGTTILALAVAITSATACVVPRPPGPVHDFTDQIPIEKVVAYAGTWAFKTKLKQNRLSPRETDGKTVTQVVHRIAQAKTGDDEAKKQKWDVRVVEDTRSDALAFPGGGVIVSTAMLESVCGKQAGDCLKEGQLAAVLGHEMVHVLDNHFIERMKEHSDLLVALTVAIKNNPTTWEKNLDPQTVTGVLALFGVVHGAKDVIPFAREQETNADTRGLRLMACNGGYPSEDALLYREAARKGGGEWSMMHPSDDERIQVLAAESKVVDQQCPPAAAEQRAASERAGAPARLASGTPRP